MYLNYRLFKLTQKGLIEIHISSEETEENLKRRKSKLKPAPALEVAEKTKEIKN